MTETNTQSHPEDERQESAAHCLCGGTGPRITRLVEAMMPSGEAGAHFRQAHLELLKGLRAVLDQRIQSMSQPRHGTKITVE
jgi:hypothetical protein